MPLVHSVTLSNDMARARLLRDLQRAPLKDERGREMYVVVHRIGEQKKPLKQKGLFYAWCQILANHAGCSLGDMKRDLKDEFLPMVETVNYTTGEVKLVRQSTEDPELDWHPFLLQIEVLGREFFGITLPAGKDDPAWEAFKRAKHAA